MKHKLRKVIRKICYFNPYIVVEKKLPEIYCITMWNNGNNSFLSRYFTSSILLQMTETHLYRELTNMEDILFLGRG